MCNPLLPGLSLSCIADQKDASAHGCVQWMVHRLVQRPKRGPGRWSPWIRAKSVAS